MQPRFPGASKLALAAHCVYPWTSGARWPASGPRTPSQRYGDAFHALAEHVGQNVDSVHYTADATGADAMWKNIDAAAQNYAEEHDLTPRETDSLRTGGLHIHDALDADHVVKGRRHVEIAAAFDPYAGTRRMLQGAERAEPHELYARADLVFERADGVFVIRDWKTGEKARDARPRDTAQLRALALAFYSPCTPAPGVRVEIAHVSDEGIDVEGDDLSAEDLRAAEAELVELAGRLAEPAEPKPGPWCERLYCPMQATCPATLNALASVDAELTVHPMRGPLVGPEHAAHLRHRLPMLKAWIEDREREIKELAKRAPLPVEGKADTWWGPVEFPGHEKIIATPEAIETVRGELPFGADKAISTEISKASIERGVRAQVLKVHGGNRMPRGAGKALTDKIFQELRKEGAMKKGAPHVRFVEFKRMGDALLPEETESTDG